MLQISFGTLIIKLHPSVTLSITISIILLIFAIICAIIAIQNENTLDELKFGWFALFAAMLISKFVF